jgi:hypothetical protein
MQHVRRPCQPSCLMDGPDGFQVPELDVHY